jgi:hypothetical protein
MTLGNSITNGAGTRANANHRWPDVPAARLRAAALRRGVANMGIAGSRLLHDPPAVRPAEANARYFRRGALCRDNRDMRPSGSVRRRLFR